MLFTILGHIHLFFTVTEFHTHLTGNNFPSRADTLQLPGWLNDIGPYTKPAQQRHETVIHLSINKARRSVTALMKCRNCFQHNTGTRCIISGYRRLRSIVMTVSICAPRHLRKKTRLISIVLLWMLPMALDRYSTGMASKSQVEGAISGVFFAFNTALYSTACCTHTKTTKMPFGMMSVLGPSNNVPTYFVRITVCDESPDPPLV